MEMRQAPACFFQSVSRRNQTIFLPNDLAFKTSQESGIRRQSKRWTLQTASDFMSVSNNGSLWNPGQKRETERLVKLYNIDEDPTERNDISDAFPEVKI